MLQCVRMILHNNMNGRRKSIGCCCIAVGVLFAPLLPFAALLLFPFIAIVFNVPVLALLFSILFDSFLLPSSAPFWMSLSFYTIILLPICAYLRYTTTL